jgi:hypothetical protein
MRIVAVVALVLLVSACGGSPERAKVTSPCEGKFAQGEFGSNFAVTAELSRAPAVGEEATVTVGVCAKEAAKAVVSVKLPPGFEWHALPKGMTTGIANVPGCPATAAGTWDLAAMTPLTVTGTVAATKAGTAELGAFVEPVDGPGPGNAAYVYLTVGEDSSHFGYPDTSSDSSATTVTPKAPKC